MTRPSRGMILIALAAASLLLAGAISAKDAPPPPTGEPPMAPPPADLARALTLEASEWSVRAGDTLSDTLKRWSLNAHWTVVWQLESDYPIDANYGLPLGTSFVDAAHDVVEAFQGRRPAPKGCVYRNSVLLVIERGAPCPR